MAAAHGLDRRTDPAVQLADHVFDFLGGLLGALGQGSHFIGHHGESAPLLAGPGRLDGGVEGQEVGLLGDALDHLQYPADGLAVAGQLVDHPHRLVDFTGQPGNAALLGFHQAPAVDGFVVDAMGTADRRRGAAGHFLGGGGHLVHRRGHLLDLAALAGHRLVAPGRDVFHLPGLALDLADGMPDPLDQIVDLQHRAVEQAAQLSQLVATVGGERDGHVAGRDLVHHHAQATQGGAGRGVETAIEVDDRQEHQGQGRHQQHHVATVLRQALLQLDVEELQGVFVELVGLPHQLADLLVERRPGRLQGLGHHHLLLEQLAGLLEAGLAGIGRAVEGIVSGAAGAQGVLELEAILGLEFFDLHQQFVETGAGGRIEKTLAQGEGAHGPAFAQDLGDLRGDAGDQLAELADIALGITAEARLAGDDLAEQLRAAQQLADQPALVQQRVFHLLGLEGRQQFIALGVEDLHLLGVAGHRLHGLQALEHQALLGGDLALQVPRLAGLAQAGVDLHLVVQGLQVAAQGQAAAQQVKALQFDPGALELAVGIAHQIKVGHQHGDKEQHADQAELHAEAQAIHQRDGGIEQALHKEVSLFFYFYWQAGEGSR